jgi:phenylacetate-CoA ligase
MPERTLREHQERRFQELLSDGLTPFYRAKWAAAGLDTNSIKSLADLPRLPFTAKDELLQDQAAHPPYGTNLVRPVSAYVRLHQTSGTTTGKPLRWLDTPKTWDWMLRCWQTIYDAVGVTAADRFFFPFSFGPFLGFWAAFEGAARRGCLVLPGGGANSAARLHFLLENSATVLCSTPTYALRLVEVAHEEKLDLTSSSVRLLILAGEPGANIPATRKLIEAGWGARGPKSARSVSSAATTPAAFTSSKRTASSKWSMPEPVKRSRRVMKGN